MRDLYFFPLLGVLLFALVMILIAESWAAVPNTPSFQCGQSPAEHDVMYAHQQTLATGVSGPGGCVSPSF